GLRQSAQVPPRRRDSAREGLETVISSEKLLHRKKVVDAPFPGLYRRVRSIALHQLHRSPK
ncbi:MAG TPA: hypothetical protein VMJ74_16605, partial [Pseudomonadales bacterium]|nr:hypothetical protein [Pseudomonadales bacterium]